LSVAIGGYLAAGLLSKQAASSPLLSPARELLLPGKTTHGHYQIELACEACHAKPFGGREALQETCTGCHAAELKAANDTHPLAKFTDPRNADRLEKLDATLCVTCHVEHRPAVTGRMGVTLAGDFCFHCHQDIAKDRPSHEGMAFNTCNSAGCHKYHDNRALYEDFLAKHLDSPALKAGGKLRARSLKDALEIKAPLAQGDLKGDPPIHQDWLQTAHAKAGVNCSGCHKSEAADARQSCAECHQQEDKGFRAGKHGMRLAAGLSPMTPGMARRPMRAEAKHTELGCTTCHAAHRFDTQKAAVQACLGCHDDSHSKGFSSSKHAAGGVTCASCHMPRVEFRDEDLGIRRTLVQHNQSETLSPAEKMIRPVCLECHGLGFSIDALAGQPVQSLDMVRKRIANRERSNK
jgi:formate-dependent nitrite reductase cytochrome c552 subunit